MSLEDKLQSQVEDVLQTSTVKQAGRVLRSRSGLVMLSVISFLESALPVPIMTDPFLMAAILADRTRAFKLVLVTLGSSVVGGVVAYFMALFFLDILLSFMSAGVVEEFQDLVNGNTSSTLVITLVGAVTPIPYTLVAWLVAFLEGSILVFIIGSVLGRGFRYAVVGYTTYQFGDLAISYAKRYIGLASVLVILLAIAFFWLKM